MLHDLKSLKKHLLHNGVEIKSYDGAFLTTKKGDVWGLFDDQFYMNGVLVDRKTIFKEFPKKIA